MKNRKVQVRQDGGINGRKTGQERAGWELEEGTKQSGVNLARLAHRHR